MAKNDRQLAFYLHFEGRVRYAYGILCLSIVAVYFYYWFRNGYFWGLGISIPLAAIILLMSRALLTNHVCIKVDQIGVTYRNLIRRGSIPWSSVAQFQCVRASATVAPARLGFEGYFVRVVLSTPQKNKNRPDTVLVGALGPDPVETVKQLEKFRLSLGLPAAELPIQLTL